MPIFSSDFKISDEKPLDEISDITYQFLPESARGTHGTNSEPSGIQSVDGSMRKSLLGGRDTKDLGQVLANVKVT